MPTKELDIGNLFIVDPNTGERTELKDIPTLTMTTDETLDYEPIIGWDKPKEFTATMEVKEIGMRMINMLRGRKVFKGSMDDISLMLWNFIFNQWVTLGESTIYDIKIKQNRTHKKHRINKKWAKRYGYTCTVFCE